MHKTEVAWIISKWTSVHWTWAVCSCANWPAPILFQFYCSKSRDKENIQAIGTLPLLSAVKGCTSDWWYELGIQWLNRIGRGGILSKLPLDISKDQQRFTESEICRTFYQFVPIYNFVSVYVTVTIMKRKAVLPHHYLGPSITHLSYSVIC